MYLIILWEGTGKVIVYKRHWIEFSRKDTLKEVFSAKGTS